MHSGPPSPLPTRPAAVAKTMAISESKFDLAIHSHILNDHVYSLMQFFNGWIQNVNAYSSSLPLGKYFNLKVCG